jgi:hypothetical protein
MSKGPQGQKRPADLIGRLVMAGRVATEDDVGVIQGGVGHFGKSDAATRGAPLLQEQRSEIGRKAVEGRWG